MTEQQRRDAHIRVLNAALDGRVPAVAAAAAVPSYDDLARELQQARTLILRLVACRQP